MSETRQQLVEDLKALLNEDVTAVKDQVEHIKTQFYRLSNQSAEATVNEAAEAVNDAVDAVSEAVQPAVDAIEEQFRELLGQYKAKRAEVAAQQAGEMQANWERKQAIVAEMKTMAEGETDGVMANLQRMRELQAEWKTIGAVPADKVQELRKAYQQYQEQFYDLVKINIELRDLDFKKNLEMKTLLCEAAERLENNPNIVEANRALQQLHDEWAEIGPVARELREDLWNRFKAASTVINKRHQEYFDQLHAKEKDNLEKKQAIIAQLKELNEGIQAAEQPVRWEKLTEQVQALQNEWRTIGFAPKKFNQSIYAEYRALCDEFFHAKTAYYKGVRNELSDNLAKKRALVAKVEELKDSQDWQATADAIRELQAEWKTVGPIARKYSDELWNRFTAACDTFFNAKREAAKDERQKAKGERVARAAKAVSGNNLYHLRDVLMQEIKVAENNILFFTAKSKTANKLVDSMQKKINDLKAQLADIQRKINESED